MHVHKVNFPQLFSGKVMIKGSVNRTVLYIRYCDTLFIHGRRNPSRVGTFMFQLSVRVESGESRQSELARLLVYTHIIS